MSHRKRSRSSDGELEHSKLSKLKAEPTGAAASSAQNIRSVSSESSHDDTVGIFEYRERDLIDRRYEILSEAGHGTFGTVLYCRDLKTKCTVAVKAVRKVKKYTDSAEIEVDYLRDVNDADPENKSLCVRILDAFKWRGRMFIVFEQLGGSLYDYLKHNSYRPLPLYCVQAFADQLVRAVAFLHRMRLIHTDLKPENILLRSRGFRTASRRVYGGHVVRASEPYSTDVRLIDFGGATYDDEHKSSIINTRQYRAPEVIIGAGWSMPSDVWSVGCIIMELYRGELLFNTHDSLEHLALMERCLGEFPAEFVCRGEHKCEYFDNDNKLRYPAGATEESRMHVASMRSLRDIIHKSDNVFYDLISRMLVFDPQHRITAEEAVNHPFFTAVRGTIEVPQPKGTRSKR